MNVSKRHFRRRSRQRATAPGKSSAVPSGDRVDVLAALRLLPERQRQATVLHYLLDCPVAAVAELMGLPTGASGLICTKRAPRSATHWRYVMPDELSTDLESALKSEQDDRPPDLAWGVARGRRIRALRWITVALGAVAVVAAVSTALVALPKDGRSSDQTPSDRSGPPLEPQYPREANSSEVAEEMTEQEEAEIFAFRALAHTGLMNPFGKRSYNFTSADDTTQRDDGWRIGFAASDCQPRDGAFTCRGLSGEDPELGNALTDTFVIVRLVNHEWRVVEVEGNMLGRERERLIGHALPRYNEPSHWEFPAVGVWPTDDGVSVHMMPVWVGPFPTSAPGSVCEMVAYNAAGNVVGEPSSFYQEPPTRDFDRAGWVRGTGYESDTQASRVNVNCRQYTGPGWEVASGPTILGRAGAISGVEAELVWRGDEGFTSAAVCRATLVNENGEVVGEGSARVDPLWRSDELKNYPYRADVFVMTGREPVDAEAVGDFTCASR
jgi:hypothetical protein